MKLPHRRQFLHLVAGAAALPVLSRIARAQAYPTRPVRIIASAAAGTAMDVHGRLHGQWLSERLGQPFIVETRPGAASTIGAAEAIRSRPGGYTLFLLPISLAVTANFYSKLPYNVVHDTSPIALLYQANYVMVVNPSFPVTSVPEFIAYAKANPGKVNMGSQGVGSIGHLAGELFKSMTGIDMVHVPYRSVALALADVVSGQVQVQFATSTDFIGLVGDEGIWRPLRQLDQGVVAFAVRRSHRCDSDAIRNDLKQRGIRAVIPPKSNRTKTFRYNERLYRQRNCIERVLGHLKINRAVATRYDQTRR